MCVKGSHFLAVPMAVLVVLPTPSGFKVNRSHRAWDYSDHVKFVYFRTSTTGKALGTAVEVAATPDVCRRPSQSLLPAELHWWRGEGRDDLDRPHLLPTSCA
jgi:hypothetical protein